MLDSLFQFLHLWLVRCVIEQSNGENESYVILVVAEQQPMAHRIALETVHKTRMTNKSKAYQKISITSSVIEPNKENEVVFACRVKHPKDT